MKKQITVVLLALTVLLPICATCAETALPDPFGGFLGLVQTLSGNSFDNLTANIGKKEANSVIKKLLGDAPFENTPSNADLVQYLSTKKENKSPKAPTDRKDFGLVENKYRAAYSALNANSALYCKNSLLSPASPLTYGYLAGSLQYFEDEILAHCGVKTLSGKALSVSLESGSTQIRISSSDSVINVKSKRMSDVLVSEGGQTTPYNRNISSGDEIKVYIDKKGEVFYIKIMEDYFPQFADLSDKYTLYRANIFYLEGSTALLLNSSKFNGTSYDEQLESYLELNINADTAFSHNGIEISADAVNSALLDKTAYVICDKNNNAKYFYVSE